MTGIGMCHDMLGITGLPETWPPGAGIEFGGRIEQGIATTYATTDPLIMAVPIRSGKRGLGAALAAYPVLFRAQFFAPFGIGFCNRCSHWAFIHPRASWRAEFTV